MFKETVTTETTSTPLQPVNALDDMELEYIVDENFRVQDEFMAEVLDGIFNLLSGSLLYTFGNKEYGELMDKLFIKSDDTITLARASVLEYIRAVYRTEIDTVDAVLSSKDNINIKAIIGAQRYGDIVYRHQEAEGSLFKTLRFILFVKIASAK